MEYGPHVLISSEMQELENLVIFILISILFVTWNNKTEKSFGPLGCAINAKYYK